MFTGIVEEVGKVKSIDKAGDFIGITINCTSIIEDIRLGDSIAVNGICLTITAFKENEITADIMPETLDKTDLRDIKPGDAVNLERALTLNGRMGGHMVSGHIDGTGVIKSMTQNENAVLISVKAEPEILRYIVKKGSIAIDGISLTVVNIDSKEFIISIIPHTLKNTVLGHKKAGSRVNLECDIIGKYVFRFMEKASATNKESSIDLSFLAKNGFM